MSNPVECPFCGVKFYKNFNGNYTHKLATSDADYCPLAGYVFSEQQWNMLPPKKEVGHTSTQEEAEWLRALVMELISRPPIVQITEPSKE